MKHNLSQCKTIAYFLVYFLLIQLSLPYFAPEYIIYNQRLNYDYVKNRPANMETVLEQVKLVIERENLHEYVIILGDSVAYSNPGPAEQSISSRLNDIYKQEGVGYPVFNLAMPAMQTGDIYTMLLKMKQYGISNDRLIINITYAGFVKRDPEPPSVYWLTEQLRNIDPSSYSKIEQTLPAYAKIDKVSLANFHMTKRLIVTFLYENINIFKYKDLFQNYFSSIIDQKKNRTTQPPQQVLPWHTKDFLPALLQQPEYQRDYTDAPFVMEDSNPQIYFLNKILEIQQGKNTIVFLSAVNDKLLQENISKPGYQENLAMIDHYFSDKSPVYLNTYGLIDNELFSDHIHLTADGYYFLSRILLNEMFKWK